MTRKEKLSKHETLKRQYVKEIRGWSWDSITESAKQNEGITEGFDHFGEIGHNVGSCYLGDYKKAQDDAFTEALEKVASERGGFITYEGGRIFFALEVPLPEVDEEEY